MEFRPQSPIVLDAITLRGIGSYLHGARLDIKPLTILCGENGSGKSTWLKALNILERSLESNRFPFGFDISDWNPQDLQITNAVDHLVNVSNPTIIHDNTKALAEFGSPGTIGLELHVTRDLKLPAQEDDDDQSNDRRFRRFLYGGICDADARIRLRVAHPTHHDDAITTPNLRHVIELQLDNRHMIRLDGERDPFQKFESGFTRPRRSKPLLLSCSTSLFSQDNADCSDVVSIATIRDLIRPTIEPLRRDIDEQTIATLLQLVQERMQELLRMALSGYFYIGAVRKPHLSVHVHDDPAPEYSNIVSRRHVGASGENAWVLERSFVSSRMRSTINPHFTVEDLEPFDHIRRAIIECDSDRDRKLARVLDRLPDDLQTRLDEVSASADLVSNQLNPGELAEALNSLLYDCDLYESDTWGEVVDIKNEHGEFRGSELIFSDASIEELGNRLSRAGVVGISEKPSDPNALFNFDVEPLSITELRFLNYLLILDAFVDACGMAPSRSQCDFDEYLCYWLNRLVQARVNRSYYAEGSSRHQPWTIANRWMGKRLQQPTPYLANVSRRASTVTRDSNSVACVVHPCFGDGQLSAVQPPRQLSAGFHQVFPIIVQLGLMQAGELLGIENPEVHLHPSLQLRITEALLEHAKSGRHVIVETHSDLVLRRVIRAILEEDVIQSKVAIYFAELSQAYATQHCDFDIQFSSSVLKPIQIDEKGRIANWPPGFLDDDIRESQRLIDIMYGKQMGPEGDDDAP